MSDFRENGECERGGLTCTGLGAADDVLAGHDQRDRAQLNGCRFDVTHGPDTFQNGNRQTELRKWHMAIWGAPRQMSKTKLCPGDCRKHSTFSILHSTPIECSKLNV